MSLVAESHPGDDSSCHSCDIHRGRKKTLKVVFRKPCNPAPLLFGKKLGEETCNLIEKGEMR